jgi:ribose transport system ATP-binding protein
MGPNGAGKSTLLKILAGVHERDAGEIFLGGKPVDDLRSSPYAGFIHQEAGLIDEMSISDNLCLGEVPQRLLGPILDHRVERARAREALDLVGLERNVATPVGELAPAEKALVAIARALHRGALILFVDEATSTLPPRDCRRFLAALRRAAEGGATVVMVTHKLSEILDTTDRVVLLLDGRLAADVDAKGFDREALVSMLVSHEVHGREVDATQAPGREILRLDGARSPAVGPLDLTLRAHEVIGLTGLPGSGLHDVAYLLIGAAPIIGGKLVAAEGLRVGLVPPHRESQGGFDRLSLTANMTISSLPRWRGPARLLSGGRERAAAKEMAGTLSIHPPEPDTEYGTLSGGNKQKVVFSRVLLGESDVYVLCEPTRGVDIATRAELYRLVRELRTRDVGVLVISSDSEDLFAVCDRIGVVEGGRIARLVDRVDDLNQKEMEEFV